MNLYIILKKNKKVIFLKIIVLTFALCKYLCLHLIFQVIDENSVSLNNTQQNEELAKDRNIIQNNVIFINYIEFNV